MTTMDPTPSTPSFSAPASRAWERMTRFLFRPFDIKTWLVVGFTAFLAELGARGGSSWANAGTDSVDLESLDSGGAEAMWAELVAGGFLFALGALGCFVVLLLALLITWLSSRGKFMFLDNVVHERAAVVEPWKRLKRQGDSLFLFRLAFFLACVVVFGGLIALVAGTVGFGVWSDWQAAASIGAMVTTAAAFLVLILIVFFGVFFLDAFVVPLMHRYELGVMDGWHRFLALFSRHPGAFIVCGLVVFVVAIGVGVAAVVFGLMTCCLGFLLLAIPYVSSVVVLPISVFYRSFTLEFLAQVDPGLTGAALSASGGYRSVESSS